jgi:hypothetical protein
MIDLIRERLAGYGAATPLEEEQALKEIVQEIALYALWRADFFRVAAFQGGTSLRVLYKLPRFSEYLDFTLVEADPAFDWGPYAKVMTEVLLGFGIEAEILDKGKMDRNIRQAIIKDDSLVRQLNLQPAGGRPRLIRIKLEIDVNPPAGSGFEYSYLDFPLDFEIRHQDLPSNLALKIHALLCRPYLKGRDWYDLVWYARKKVRPNLPHLQAALEQYGPWTGQVLEVTPAWVVRALSDKIESIDWKDAARDVERFLNATERQSLSLWSERFFKAKVGQLLGGPESQ